MATPSPLEQPSDPYDFLNQRGIHANALYRRLGLLDGIMVGLIVSLFYWVPKLLPLRGIVIEQKYAGVAASSMALILFGGLLSWLTGRVNRGWFSAMGWFGLAMGFALLLGYLPSAARIGRIWLANGRFWGFPIYDLPLLQAWWVFATNGFMLIIFLTVLGLLQPNRLRASWEHRHRNGRLSLASLGRLLLPALLLAPAAIFTPDLLNRDLWSAYRMVDQAVTIVQNSEGGLFEVGLEAGISLTSFNSVREQMVGDHRLALAAYDPLTDSTALSLMFENGAWLVCNIGKNDRDEPRLSGCHDAGTQYGAGFRSLLSGQPLPESCANCEVDVDAPWRDWLAAHQLALASEATISREVVGGRFVLMRGTATDGETAVLCLLEGLNKITLLSCEEG